MSAIEINDLKEEAQRLLTINIEILESMLRVKGLITTSTEGSPQTFDTISTPRMIEILQGECTKLKTLEMVIAVVGTMKAGKSTMINAIVGTEVLPNRNRPMTALPTLIRHTPRQVEPVLKFYNNEPINILFESIRCQIATGKVEDELKGLINDADMNELLGNIQSQQHFGQQYQGANNIFWFLKTLNDLVRLSSKLKVTFPFDRYSKVEQMPVIEVEFAHLRQSGTTQGQLTLLDTPGPNEAGQDHLRYMLKDQLQKTSAILAVFDYTQLKSDADAQVRGELEKIASLHKGRLFALVNKFDQADRNGDSKEAVQKLVAEGLMNNLLGTQQVFPVSSKFGYLANRARHEIEIHQRLPDPNKEQWVADFAKEALGRRWQNRINDLAAVLESANALWEDSGFSEPLEKVIQVGHSKAALFALESASKKLKKCLENIENFLGTRFGALGKSIEELQENIKELKKNITEVHGLGEKAKNMTSEFSNRLESQIKNKIDTISSDSEGMVRSIIDNAERITKIKSVGGGNVIILNDRESADKWFRYIQNEIEKIISLQRKSLTCFAEQEFNSFINQFKENSDFIEKLINNLSQDLNKQGFSLKLKIPNTNINKVFEYSDFSIEQNMTVGTRNETYWEKRDSWWASFTNWLNDDWGKDEKVRKVNEYTIDKSNITNIVNRKLRSVLTSYKDKTDEAIINPLKKEVDCFFEEVKKVLIKIQSDFEQGIKDKQKSQNEISDLLTNMNMFLEQTKKVSHDSESLFADIDQLKQ